MKNTMKKFAAFITATVMTVSLTACGGGENTDVAPPAKDEYTEIYVLESMERGAGSFTDAVAFYGEDLYQLGFIDNYIAYKDENSGTLFYLNNQFDFTVAEGVINAGGARIPVEKAEDSVVLNMDERVLTYTRTDRINSIQSAAPAPGMYALNYISYDEKLKDRGMIDVEKENAGTYLEIFRDGTGHIVAPEGEIDFTVADTELTFSDGSMPYRYINDMMVLYGSENVVNTYILSDELPSKIAVKGHYAIKTITEDGTVYETETLKAVNLDNTALDVTGPMAATFTYGDVVLDLNIIGNVMAFSDMNTMYRFVGDTLTCDISGMTFEFIYQG